MSLQAEVNKKSSLLSYNPGADRYEVLAISFHSLGYEGITKAVTHLSHLSSFHQQCTVSGLNNYSYVGHGQGRPVWLCKKAKNVNWTGKGGKFIYFTQIGEIYTFCIIGSGGMDAPSYELQVEQKISNEMSALYFV